MATTTEIDLQGCEHCQREFDIAVMTMMDDCWFCEACVAEFREGFSQCTHQWESHTDTMGDEGQYCGLCSGFVRDEDFPLLGLKHPVARSAIARAEHTTEPHDDR